MCRALIALSIASLLGSCASARADQDSDSTSAVLSAPTITLAPGRSGSVEGTPLTIAVDAVVDDSRCPKGVDCVWAGDVAVKLRIEGAQTPSTEATLHLNIAPRDTTHGEHRVTLVDVAPYPVDGEKIPPERYRATIRVEGR